MRQTVKQKNEKLALDGKIIRNYGLKFEAKPTKGQKELFAKSFGVSRFTSNFYLRERQEVYDETLKTLRGNEFKQAFIKLKTHPHYDFLKEVDKFVVETAIESVEDAFERFFKGQTKYPKYKSKHAVKQSYSTKFTGGNIAVDLTNSTMKLPKVGKVKICLPKKLKETYHFTGFNEKILGATVSRHSSGKYFISLRIEKVVELPVIKQNILDDEIVALDWGLKHFIIDSKGRKIDNPRHTLFYAEKLAYLQRKLKKMKIGSQNYKKMQQKIAKLHLKIANTRKDFLHQISRRLINENQVIIVEDLNIKGLLKNKKLAKHIQDTGWGMFKTFLSYKANWAGKQVVFVDRFYPSSKLCSACNEKKEMLSLSEREWLCSGCGTTHDRDVNAATNIKQEGLRLLSL